jgi:hypothetical protein
MKILLLSLIFFTAFLCSFESRAQSVNNNTELEVLRQNSEEGDSVAAGFIFYSPLVYAGLSLVPLIGNIVCKFNSSVSYQTTKSWGLAALIVGGVGMTAGLLYTFGIPPIIALAGAKGWATLVLPLLVISLGNIILGHFNHTFPHKDTKQVLAISPYLQRDARGNINIGAMFSRSI